MKSVLTTRQLRYHYPKQPVMAFPDLQLENGENLLVLGESGCGKSTFLHLLAGLLRPAEGNIWVGDTHLSHLPPAATDHFRGRHIGMVFQKPYFIESLSVLDNLMLNPFSRNRPYAIEQAKRLSIDHLLHKKPAQLSAGEQQRVTIARALLHHPRLILADEPTSALDNKNCDQVIRLLLEQTSVAQAALLIVSHDDRLRNAISNQLIFAPLSQTV